MINSVYCLFRYQLYSKVIRTDRTVEKTFPKSLFGHGLRADGDLKSNLGCLDGVATSAGLRFALPGMEGQVPVCIFRDNC